MAAVVLLSGTGVIPLRNHGWNLIGSTILLGTAALWCLPELIFGRYRKR